MQDIGCLKTVILLHANIATMLKCTALITMQNTYDVRYYLYYKQISNFFQ